jgi:uncharacterized protein with NRDE domain
MCLIVLAWQVHPAWPLVVGANRDEFHHRPADPLQWWPDEPRIAAGRDLEAGGTWLGASRDGRFATVTNYRENLKMQTGERSRGALVTDFVTADVTPLAFARGIDQERYAGFSLLAATPASLAYVSNRGDAPRALAAGVYGLSNASLDTPWPKVVRSRERLQSLIGREAVTLERLFALLADREPAEEVGTPTRDLPAAKVRAVSAPFIVTPEFGTRCSTVLILGANGEVQLNERRFDAQGWTIGESGLRYRLEPL